jgi:hypothetical protein
MMAEMIYDAVQFDHHLKEPSSRHCCGRKTNGVARAIFVIDLTFTGSLAQTKAEY